MNNLVDMHTHTEHSFDADFPVDDLCKVSIEKGLKAVAFTDHIEMDCFYESKFNITADEAFDDISKAKEKYKNSIDVCVGVELGEASYNVEESEKLINSKNYDIVVASIHNLRNMEDFYFLEYSKLDIDKILKEYFYELKSLAEWGKFDTLAHITYPLRYIVGEHNIDVDMSKYKKDLDELFDILAQKDRALEINTSGLRQTLGVTMPDENYLRRYKELGGKLVTVGSDSHYDIHMGAGIEEGMKLAKKCGFDSVIVFKNRKPFEIPIE